VPTDILMRGSVLDAPSAIDPFADANAASRR
jgi:hypothetical protein